MYTTNKLLHYLSRSKYWLADGTFKIVPKIFHQLYVIHGSVYNNVTFPMVLGLMTNKDKASYDTFIELYWNVVHQLI